MSSKFLTLVKSLDDQTSTWLSRIGLSLLPPPLMLALFSPFIGFPLSGVLLILLTSVAFLSVVLAAENVVRYGPAEDLSIRESVYRPLLFLILASVCWAWAGATAYRTTDQANVAFGAIASIVLAMFIFRSNLSNYRIEWDKRMREIQRKQTEKLTTNPDNVNLGGREIEL